MSNTLKLLPVEESLLDLLPDGEAASLLRASGLPGRRTEEWRWSDLRAILKGPVALSEEYKGDVHRKLKVEGMIELVFANGKLMSEPAYEPQHIKLSRLTERDETVEAALTMLAANLAEYTYLLEIDFDVPRPIVIRYLSDGNGLHNSRLRIKLADGACATIIEEFAGGEGAWLSNSLSEFFVGKNAHLTRLVHQEPASEAITVNTALLNLEEGANYHQTTLGFGGKLTRLETQLAHASTGSIANINGAYLLDGRNHLDQRTLVHHLAEGCETKELYKGVLKGKGRGTFQGKFYVAREAQQTDAAMNHNALLLSEEAEVNAKPELEIYADDVQCTHGNTAGALDDEALFYMRQRGLSEHEARAMLVGAFLGEVLEDIEDEELRRQAEEIVNSFMGGDA